MPTAETISHQARIHWRCLSWFKAMKWPSANEVDFGDFLVEFDFKRGVISKKPKQGAAQTLATFVSQPKTREVCHIQGAIHCDVATIHLGTPLVTSEGKVQLQIELADPEGQKSHTLCGNVKQQLTFGEAFTISPKTQGSDTYLSAETSTQAENLAVLIASLLVFQRFAA